jgi:VWFA-related protein
MNKIIVAMMFLALLCLSIFSQDVQGTRPRVVPTSSPSPIPTPIPTPTPASISQITIAPPPPMPVDDDEVLNIETNLVTLPASVLDKNGRYISNLRKSDFEIYENGIRQQVDHFAKVESPFTVVLLIDVSPSTKYKINEIQDAAISFVDQLRPEDKLVVLTFSNKLRIISQQTTSFPLAKQAIRNTKFGEGTSIYEAVDYTINNLLGSIEGRKAIVILSDGVDTSSTKSSYSKTVGMVERIDATVYSVRYNTFEENQTTSSTQYSLGASPQEYRRGKEYLIDLSKASGGQLYEAQTTKKLEEAFQNISQGLRLQYTLGYYPEIDGEDGERRLIKINVKNKNYTVKTKENYIFKSND